jgi:hypothetical protein
MMKMMMDPSASHQALSSGSCVFLSSATLLSAIQSSLKRQGMAMNSPPVTHSVADMSQATPSLTHATQYTAAVSAVTWM